MVGQQLFQRDTRQLLVSMLVAAPLFGGVCGGGTATGGSSRLLVSRNENRPANQVKKPGLSCWSWAVACFGRAIPSCTGRWSRAPGRRTRNTT